MLKSSLGRIWRLVIPFWLFRNARCGSARESRANYSFNRQRRGILPLFISKWVAMGFCLLQMLNPLATLLAQADPGSTWRTLLLVACVVSGIGFVFAAVAIVILLSSYFYLCFVPE